MVIASKNFSPEQEVIHSLKSMGCFPRAAACPVLRQGILYIFVEIRGRPAQRKIAKVATTFA